VGTLSQKLVKISETVSRHKTLQAFKLGRPCLHYCGCKNAFGSPVSHGVAPGKAPVETKSRTWMSTKKERKCNKAYSITFNTTYQNLFPTPSPFFPISPYSMDQLSSMPNQAQKLVWLQWVFLTSASIHPQRLPSGSFNGPHFGGDVKVVFSVNLVKPEDVVAPITIPMPASFSFPRVVSSLDCKPPCTPRIATIIICGPPTPRVKSQSWEICPLNKRLKEQSGRKGTNLLAFPKTGGEQRIQNRGQSQLPRKR